MALPTSDFPVPAFAPTPTVGGDKPEAYAFPPQRFAAASFSTPAPATDLQYSFACGEAAQWLRSKGFAPVTTGAWAQAWVTYCGPRRQRARAGVLARPVVGVRAQGQGWDSVL